MNHRDKGLSAVGSMVNKYYGKGTEESDCR